nr:hypothetical protein FFPRI1PSEUD_63480 [Pseudomonas sp. FFPRI_1]
MESTGSTTRAGVTDPSSPALTASGPGLLPETPKGDLWVALCSYCRKPQAALNSLCGSMTNFFGTPASNSP